MAPRPRRVRAVGRDRGLLDVLPEQPNRSDRPALVLRGARRPGPRARVPALFGRGVLGVVVRGGARIGAPGRRPLQRGRLQHAFETLFDDWLPLRVRLRLAGRRGRAARVPSRHSARHRRSSSSGRVSLRCRTNGTSRRCERSIAASARRFSRCSNANGFGSPAGTRPSSCGWRSTVPSEDFARRLLESGILVAPGAFFGPDGEGYVRMALVPSQNDCERAALILEEVL